MPHPRFLLPLLFAGCLGLFAGCANPSSPNAIMNRVDANRDAYEEWPLSIKEAVLSGQVVKGMDTTMVYVARGTPAERIERGNGDEIWVYRIRGVESGGGSILPRGSSVTIGGSPYPSTYPGSYPGGYPGTYPGSSYPYPSTGSGVYLPPIVLGGGGGGGEENVDEEEIVFRNGRVTHGDGVK